MTGLGGLVGLPSRTPTSEWYAKLVNEARHAKYHLGIRVSFLSLCQGHAHLRI